MVFQGVVNTRGPLVYAGDHNGNVVTVYGWMGYPCDWLKETLDWCRVKDYTFILFYQKHGRD